MVRRSQTEARRRARDELKARHEHEAEALARFFVLQARVAKLRDEIEAVVSEQCDAVATLARSAGADWTADAVSWSKTKVRAAMSAGQGPARTSADTTTGPATVATS